jgi:hypothetical protein
MKNIGCADLHRASRDAILSNNLIKYSFMGKRAHCEVFRRHSDVPPFFLAASPDLSGRRGELPA